MRRPGNTKAQRAYARSQRALLRLRKMAVRWSVKADDQGAAEDDDSGDEPVINALTDLQAAADAYTTSLSPRERRKLSR